MNKKIVSLIAGTAIFFASFSCSSSSSNQDPQPDPDPDAEEVVDSIRVMAYNIHHANPPSKPDVIDIDAIVNVINAERPDLVALQEVDVNTGRSGPYNQAEEIANKLDMHFFFGKALDYDGGEYGVAILSKYPLSETQIHRLPTETGTNGEPRIVATARVTLPGGTVIRFGSTHLDAQSDSTNRMLQIDKIISLAKEERLPFIIAGDFNAVPDSEVISILDSHFTRTCRLCPFTSSANNPIRTIDYIAYHHPSKKFKVKNHEVISNNYASDHLPIAAKISVLK